MSIRDAAKDAFRVLVIDSDPSAELVLSSLIAHNACQVIACDDMALAEAATDNTQFDLILMAPSSTGVGGTEGLTAADFLSARNPGATLVWLLADDEDDLQAAIKRRGKRAFVHKGRIKEELQQLCSQLGLPLR